MNGPNVAGDIVKPSLPCGCGSTRGWRLQDLIVQPSGDEGPQRERQSSQWSCVACHRQVVVRFVPGEGETANTAHPPAEET
jgi:hypothetical protein